MRSGLVASMVLLWEFQSKLGPATRMQWYSMPSDPKHNYLPCAVRNLEISGILDEIDEIKHG